MDTVRQTLLTAAARAEVSLLRLSRLLGRNDAWLQQFVRRGTPRVLPERERRILADYLGIDEAALGGPAARTARVRRLAVAASAGPGALADDEAGELAELPLALLGGLADDPARLTMIRARGDSMLPTIADGDDILVDAGDRRVVAKGGIFVLRLDGAVLVKRLRLAGGAIAVASDNPTAAPIAPLAPGEADVIGRVVWLGRRIAPG